MDKWPLHGYEIYVCFVQDVVNLVLAGCASAQNDWNVYPFDYFLCRINQRVFVPVFTGEKLRRAWTGNLKAVNTMLFKQLTYIDGLI